MNKGDNKNFIKLRVYSCSQLFPIWPTARLWIKSRKKKATPGEPKTQVSTCPGIYPNPLIFSWEATLILSELFMCSCWTCPLSVLRPWNITKLLLLCLLDPQGQSWEFRSATKSEPSKFQMPSIFLARTLTDRSSLGSWPIEPLELRKSTSFGQPWHVVF